MQVITLGPWLLPVSVIAILLGCVAGEVAARAMRRQGRADAAPALWWLLLAALVAGRAAYVLRWWPAYRASPWWSVFDIRDRGFAPFVAGAVLVLATLLVAWRRPALRRALPVAAAAGLAVAVLTVVLAAQLQTASHPLLPKVELRQLDDQPMRLTTLAGEPMVINLWASWCPPCRAEMPMLISASRSTPGVRFVFVDQGESANAVRAFLRTQAFAPKHLLLDGASDLSRHYRAPGYPTTLFVDADGRLRDMYVGPLSRATLAAHISAIRPRFARMNTPT